MIYVDRHVGLDGRAVDRAGEARAQGRARPPHGRGSLQRLPIQLERRRALYLAPVAFSPPKPMRRRSSTSTGSNPRRHGDRSPRSARRSRNRSTAGYLRQVIFITDGAVAGETSAVHGDQALARRRTAVHDRHRLGAELVLHAQGGAVRPRHLHPHREVAEITGTMTAPARQARARRAQRRPPRLAGAPSSSIRTNAGPLRRRAARVTASFRRPWRAARCGRRSAGLANAPWSQRVTAPTRSLPGIAALWARRKIEYLTDSRVDGTDEALIRKLVVDVALEHHLVSPYTSLVAVDKTPARTAAAALERQDVENATPAGARTLDALPQTATPAPLYDGSASACC